MEWHTLEKRNIVISCISSDHSWQDETYKTRVAVNALKNNRYGNRIISKYSIILCWMEQAGIFSRTE